MALETFEYDNRVARNFAIATVLWGVVGMLLGLIVAILLYLPDYLGHPPFLSFGRLRPLHTNAVIFAFAGNAIFTAVYYSLQRLLKARMYSDFLSQVHFWGWQLIIVLAALTLPLGYTTSKEYAELEWPIDILIAIIWVVFGINMIGTILKRREKHIYVAIWFYLATFITVAVLHIGNSIEIPVSFFKSYPVYSGAQDALVQWWYGHNAVAFFLTTPFLGLMYYFIPKAANRPVYSYRLSVVHFWALIFIYIWAGPHHLLYTALPDWAQSLGAVFSVMLIAPSWGGMINGLLTLRGAWDRVRQDPVLKFLVVGVTAYGMSTFEGPMMSLKNVNAITHYTDYVIGHAHLGGLAWNGGLAAGMLYYVIPRLYQTPLHSIRLANLHFWFYTLGIVFYVIPLYWGGITQALMWKQFNPDGSLTNPDFLQTVTQLIPMYVLRSIGGLIYLTGFLIMAYNLLKTIKAGSFIANEQAQAPALTWGTEDEISHYRHRILERKPILFSLLVFISIIIGGIVEYVPLSFIKDNIPRIAGVKPYTPLELEGRDIYIREGCYTCHSQMIRPFRSETERYGDYSKAGEFIYDHPFLWGSKRTGPDLAREGVVEAAQGRSWRTNRWHYDHLINPRKISPGSIMPAYPWLAERTLDTSLTQKKIRILTSLGVDYPKGYDQVALDDLKKQAEAVARCTKISPDENLRADTEIISLIAYLQRLGVDLKGQESRADKCD